MGVPGSGGVGEGAPRHRQSHVAYFVATMWILGLLIIYLVYFCYFFIKKATKVSSVDSSTQTKASEPPPTATAAYPVQPVVREGASVMAKLCKQPLPPPGKRGAVYPTSTSPAAIRTDTGDAPHSDFTSPWTVAPGIPSAHTGLQASRVSSALEVTDASTGLDASGVTNAPTDTDAPAVTDAPTVLHAPRVTHVPTAGDARTVTDAPMAPSPEPVLMNSVPLLTVTMPTESTESVAGQ